MTRALATIVGATALAAAAALGCTQNTGSPPPVDRFFFPTTLALHRPQRAPGAAVDPPADFLYVVNSDFDLAYNGSTVVAVDLRCVQQALALGSLPSTADQRCAFVDVPGERSRPFRCRRDPNSPFLSPHATPDDTDFGRVCSDDAFILRPYTLKLNPYAVESALARYRDGATQRFYVVVRGGNALAWFDVDDHGKLDCGTPDADGFCAAGHFVGNDPGPNAATPVLPLDPSSISVDEGRGWIALSHQSVDATLPHASLFYDPAYQGPSSMQSSQPRIVNVVGGIATGLSSLALLPRACVDVPAMGTTPAMPCAERSTWFATSRNEANFTLLQAYGGTPDLGDNRAFLYRSTAAPVPGLNTGSDLRAVVLDPAYARDASSPTKVAYATSRRPEALLTIDLSNPSVPTVTDVISLPSGPSRLAAVRRRAPGAAADRTLVYVASFDARWISVVDPAEHLILERIPANRGPHQMVYDEAAGYLYVVDFLDAAVEVIDVRPTLDGTTPNRQFNRRVLTLGGPGRAP